MKIGPERFSAFPFGAQNKFKNKQVNNDTIQLTTNTPSISRILHMLAPPACPSPLPLPAQPIRPSVPCTNPNYNP